MPTSFPMSIPHAPTGSVNQAALDAAFSIPMNDLYTLISAAATSYIGNSSTGAGVTLSTTSAFASTTSVTFTLAVQTRVRIDVSAVFAMVGAGAARYIARSAYNSGASPVIGSAIVVGSLGSCSTATAGASGSPSSSSFGTDLLAAGTYTAYASVQRVSGGGATDTAGNFSVFVSTVGFI